MKTNLPSEGLHIDRTNDLLSKVPGLNFKIPGVEEAKQPGAASSKPGIDPVTLQIEQTNDLVSKVLGKEFANEIAPPKKSIVENQQKPQPTVGPVSIAEGEAQMKEKAQEAHDHLMAAHGACKGVEGLEDICEEIEEMVAEIKEMISEE